MENNSKHFSKFNAIKDCDWKSLRANKDENKGDPELSFDAIVSSKLYGEVIVEYTRIYPSSNPEPLNKTKNNKTIKPNQEIATIRSRMSSGGFNSLPMSQNTTNFSKNDLINSIKEAIIKKSSKKYSNNFQPKILILELETFFFGIFIMKEFGKQINNNHFTDISSFFNFIFDEVFIKLNKTQNKFDEVVLITYPFQPKEASYFIRCKILLRETTISEKYMRRNKY